MSVTNLTGYTWRPNDSLTGLPSSSITYNINYKLSKDVGLGNASYALMYVTSTSIKVAVSSSSFVVVYDSAAWTNKPKYFYFTGGTDAINSDLIAWLETNGTLSDRHNNLGNLLTDIADGIRDAYGVSGSINAQNFPEQLNCGKGAIASNITTSDTTTDVPLVSTEGLIGVKYMSALTIPSSNTLDMVTNYNRINTVSNQAGITTINNNATITTLNNYYTLSTLNNYYTLSTLNNNDASINTLNNSGTITSLVTSGTISGGQNTGNITINNYEPNEGKSGNITINDGGAGVTPGGSHSVININNAESYVNINGAMQVNVPTNQWIATLDVIGSIGAVENISSTGKVTQINNSGSIGDSSFIGVYGIINNSTGNIYNLSNSGTIHSLWNYGTVGDSSYSYGENTGDIYINHATNGSGNVHVKPYGGIGTKVISGGELVTSTWREGPQGANLLCTVTPSTSVTHVLCFEDGWSSTGDYIKINAVSLEAKTATALTLGTAITPSSSYSGMSSFTLNGGGTITNPSGITTSLSNGGTIAALTNTSTITALSNTNTISTLTNSGTISNLAGTGTISSINGGASQYIAELGNSSGLGSLYIKCINGNTGTMYGNVYIGTDISSASGQNASLRIYNRHYSTTEASDYLCIDVNSGKNLMYLYNKNGTVRTISNSGTSAGTSTIGSLGNGDLTSGYLGVITSLNNTTNGTIATLTNSGTITNLKMNGGTIGNSETATSSSTGQKGLYGTSGIIYVSATGSSTPASSIYRLNNLTLKAGSSTTYYGAFLTSLNVNSYAQIGTQTISANGRVKSFSNSGYLGYDTQSYNYNGGYIGSSSYPVDNRGYIYLKHGSTLSGTTYIKPYNATCGNITVISNGKATKSLVQPVSSISTLESYLVAANSGILFRYTGTTGTSSSGITYTNGNIYYYES